MAERVLVVIPARYASSRFPGKALADLAGRPLVVRTVERALGMAEADRVVVATDDARIRDAVAAAGHEAILTGEHATGTDRIGEVLERCPADLIVNLQGDEPLLDPEVGDRLVRALRADPDLGLATCAHPLTDEVEWGDPNVVKVLVDRHGRALYFSRAAVPGRFPGPAGGSAPFELARRHVGIYAWRADALRRYLSWPRGELERCEQLEQLRALEQGLSVAVVTVASGPVGVDTPEDLHRVRQLWRESRHGGDPDDGSPGRNG
ncbi:3-deoxy-manno-octulosonate cytidylyltransferase [bacterium]|nr:3-deoxy-manno-octulosonate cytidylyltransferase [bacterium]